MSDQSMNDPFATPAPGASQWQGSPVPPPPSYASPQAPLHMPPPSVPQGPALATIAYPPPPPVGYGYATAYNPGSTTNNWMGITSLILSLATLVFGITCIPGVILGHMGLSAAKKGTASNGGLALAGVIIGWVFVGIGLLFAALFAIAIAVDGSGA